MSDEAKPAGAGELDLNAIRGQLNLPETAGEKEIIGALLQVIAAIPGIKLLGYDDGA